MKVKGTKKISKTLEKWANKNGFNVEVNIGKDFGYSPVDELIEWTPVVDVKADKQFRKYVKRLDKNCDVNDFVLSYLHELGHHNTLDNMPEKLYYKSRHLENIILKIPYTRLCNYLYFRLPHEKVATKWAVDFAKRNPRQIEKLNKKLYKGFKDFYEKNGIEQ